ncbi:hypothetical protein [Vreelandella aquamarina]|uniref:hypothetical protein n=1 Tax=Vreelandella aquamarina TaxID=77097 RepID=UPI000785C39B|nr:hypothetical protein [Halomonas axialensis]
MTPNDHQQVINQLQGVIDNTQYTIDRFEATGMDEQMPGDYEKLLGILDDAVKQQREHTQVMLGLLTMLSEKSALIRREESD